MLYQNSSCTSSGVPRKNQMYSQLAPETSGFGDSRITASRTPSTIPIDHRQHGQLDRDQDAVEDPRVEQVWPTTCHWKPGLVTIGRMIDAAITSTIDDRDPPPRVADRDGLDVLGPPRSLSVCSEVLTSEP